MKKHSALGNMAQQLLGATSARQFMVKPEPPPKERKPRGRPRKATSAPEQAQPVVMFPRADPEALAAFDPATKRCSMNCGPSTRDPRTRKERMFLCDECWEVKP